MYNISYLLIKNGIETLSESQKGVLLGMWRDCLPHTGEYDIFTSSKFEKWLKVTATQEDLNLMHKHIAEIHLCTKIDFKTSYKTTLDVYLPHYVITEKLRKFLDSKEIDIDVNPHDSSFVIYSDDFIKLNETSIPEEYLNFKQFISTLTEMIKTDNFEGEIYFH